jgi:hypothetical protein
VFFVKKPVTYVEVNIRAKGIHVPTKLANMSKLLLIKSATTKKSTIITKPTNIKAVCKGVVYLNLEKYMRETTAKKIGAPIAWMISVLSNEVVAIPIPIVAAQSAQPIKAWTRIVMIFLRFMVFSFLPLGWPHSVLGFRSVLSSHS